MDCPLCLGPQALPKWHWQCMHSACAVCVAALLDSSCHMACPICRTEWPQEDFLRYRTLCLTNGIAVNRSLGEWARDEPVDSCACAPPHCPSYVVPLCCPRAADAFDRRMYWFPLPKEDGWFSDAWKCMVCNADFIHESAPLDIRIYSGSGTILVWGACCRI